MNSSDEYTKSTCSEDADVENESSDIEAEPEDALAHLFYGDHGSLSFDSRRVLIQLLSGPCLDERRHKKLWHALSNDEEMIRARLSDLFLDLVIDRDHGMAFIRQVQVDDTETPSLLRKIQLGYLDTALVLLLRLRLAQADANSDRAVVDTTEITDYLMTFKRTGHTDHSGFAKNSKSAIDKFKKANILQSLPNTTDRFEISPTLRLLFSAEEIQAVTRSFKQTLEGDSNAAGRDQSSEVEHDIET